ncbi:MAG TPA: 2-oxo acid dehydrogenase subunit E2 [Bacteroidales bacterium]|jgi:pyruvate dehydrogenase E2 component (dihydrolipoamide acetyltransferase)|nr:2-oxo acid dehydrogenase subunit E2 [Bacteroidales bacterium]HBZ19880.1 2-oxo acid dehydrogenase subunit E2 [Bacteroidales bacterium]
MAIPVIMPRQGQSVETCIITKWFRQKGDTVKSGDLLFSYETDKAAFDVESPSDGTILEIFYGNGAEVPVLVNVALIGNAGEKTDQITTQLSGESIPPEINHQSFETLVQETSVLQADAADETREMKIRISPRAKRYAEKKGLNFYGIRGSGPNGRIICSDIENAVSPTEGKMDQVDVPGDEFTEQPLSNVRKLIARTMHVSLQNSAQLTHHMSADVRNILEARRKIKEGLKNGSEKQDITLNDMICLCVIKAIKKFPEVNAHFFDDRIKMFNKVHLGIAVDTPRGLMVPSVKNADDMDLQTLSRELKSSAEACKKGNINPELIKSTAASFTVSNLGNYGVEMFTPVVNLPQTAILGVCTIINRPADLGNSTFGFVPYIGLSLTYDHRAIDGGPATLFLREIKEQIEKFSH